MLVLSRRIGESFVIGEDTEVTVVDIIGEKVVLGVLAPKEIPIARLDAPPKADDGDLVNRRSYGRQYKQKLSEDDK